MSTIQHTIDVDVPLRQVYDQWTQFEDFPYFMSGVESVRQLDDTHLHWVATVAGKSKEWDAVITEQTPDKRIAWTSTTGAPNAGMVEFMRVSDASTRVTLTMDIQPEGGVEKVGDAVGIPSGQVKADLEKFKRFIEDRGSATGAWRGEVDAGQVTSGSGTSGMGAGSRMGSGAGMTAGAGMTTGAGMTAGAGAGNRAGSDSDLAGNRYGTGSTETRGGSFAEGQASDLGERELTGAGSAMGTSGGATPDDPYGIGADSDFEGTDYNRSMGQTGYGGTGAETHDPLDAERRRDIPDV